MTGTKLTSSMGAISYAACVLWMAGWSAKSIGSFLNRLPGSVKGIAQRHFADRPRSGMSIAERQAVIDEMRTDRRDCGLLEDHHFKALPLWGARQKRLQNSKVGKKLLTTSTKTKKLRAEESRTPPTSRRALRKWQKEEKARRAQREHGLAEKRGEKGSALEYLAKRTLTDPEERGFDNKLGTGSSGRRRLEAGLQLRKYIAGTRIGSVGAVNFETTGLGSNLGLPPSAYRLQCIETLGIIRGLMTTADYTMIEAVVDQDDFPWERAMASRSDRDAFEDTTRADERARGRVYENIRRVLDIVAAFEGLMHRDVFKARWGYALPYIDRPASRAAAAELSAEAARILAGAR